MITLLRLSVAWRKSSYSGMNIDSDCVEVMRVDEATTPE
jgi:uncharacterized protein DUF397